MYTLSYNIYSSVGVMGGESIDEVDDKFARLLCNHWDGCSFDNKVYDMRYKRVIGSPVEYERYEETADIVDSLGKKVGRYTIKKVQSD